MVCEINLDNNTLYRCEERGDEVWHHHVGQDLLCPLWHDLDVGVGGGGGGDEPMMPGRRGGRFLSHSYQHVVFVLLLVLFWYQWYDMKLYGLEKSINWYCIIAKSEKFLTTESKSSLLYFATLLEPFNDAADQFLGILVRVLAPVGAGRRAQTVPGW